jgi:hypothetical protein
VAGAQSGPSRVARTAQALRWPMQATELVAM